MRFRFVHFALAALLAGFATASAGAQSGPAVVQRIAVVPSKRGLSVQITASRAVVPDLSRLIGPFRVVIDLPDTILPGKQRHIPVHANDIVEVRASQFRKTPPVTRIVLELTAAREYSVITTGNKMAVWLLPGTGTPAPAARRAPHAAATPPAAPAQPAPSYVPAAAPPPVVAANFQTLRGADSVSAMENPTVLRLPRGGEIHVCPGTTLSVTPSKSGRDLMLALSTGTIETHYTLGSAADMIVTPDFRILLPGPGDFHLAVSADRQGNTCVRTLEGNTASAVVSEIMGNDTYQVNATDQLMFRGGRLRSASSMPAANCGCPLQTVPVMRAETPPTPTASALPPGRTSTTTAHVTTGNRVEVDAPFVFRAVAPKVPDAPQVASLHFANDPPPELLTLDVNSPARITYYRLKPQKANSDKPRGFFAKLRGFFGGMFR